MPLETYLPKKEALTTKFSESLTPSESSRPSHPSAAISYPHKDRKVDGIKFKEKRLDARIWRCEGVHQRGSHFPICVFTNNVGRRSPQKLEERKQKQLQRSWQGSQWRTTRGRDCRSPPRARTQQWSPERPPLRARPQQSQAQERPAVAGEQPDACARWRARRDAYDQYDRRRDEQEATRTSGDPHYIQANSETWIAGWTGGWSVPGAEWTAVAAEATNVGAQSWWRREPEAPDNETPAGALREVVRTLDDYECSQVFRYQRVSTAL